MDPHANGQHHVSAGAEFYLQSGTSSNGNFPSDPTVSDGTSTAQASTFTNVLSPIVQSSKRPRSNSDPNEPSKKISQDQSVEYSIPTSNSFSALQNLQDSEEINPIPPVFVYNIDNLTEIHDLLKTTLKK